jgi:hypothetical protein
MLLTKVMVENAGAGGNCWRLLVMVSIEDVDDGASW